MFSKFYSIVFTTLQLKFKATGRTTTEAGIMHGGESTYPVVPLKFCRALLCKEDSGRNSNHWNCPAVGIALSYLMHCSCLSMTHVQIRVSVLSPASTRQACTKVASTA